mmetsp:Transcript_33779/g.24826  ORF Transcript_33779/g.24826 Transcript_33779/m.24826 type:complete len:114 (+) Transcript_33779:543-884(+)
MVDVDVTHVCLLSKKFSTYFLSRSHKSGLINVSSLSGYFELAGGAVYSASKAFVNFLTHPLAFELQGKVDVQCLTASATKTAKTMGDGVKIPFVGLFTTEREVEASLGQLPTG